VQLSSCIRDNTVSKELSYCTRNEGTLRACVFEIERKERLAYSEILRGEKPVILDSQGSSLILGALLGFFLRSEHFRTTLSRVFKTP